MILMPEKPEKIETGGKTSQSSLAKKTGSWRTFRPIITDKCIGCGLCVSYCPEGCIILIEKPKKKAIIGYNYCKGCLICMNECPTKAINKEMEK